MTRSKAAVALTACFFRKLVSSPVKQCAGGALLITLLATASGCMATSKYMTAAPVPAPALAAAPSVATVAFLRPSMLGTAVKFMIIDQNGRFVGESTAGASFAVQMPPGEYLFIAEGENTAVLHANLGPDRLYYVEIDPKMGVFSARVGLEPIKPGSDAWQKLPEMLQSTTRFVPLAQDGQAAVDAEAATIQKRIASAKEKWAGYSPEERAERSLEAVDGAPAQPAAQPAPAVAPPAPPAPPAVKSPQATSVISWMAIAPSA
jgi:hypothetical protein